MSSVELGETHIQARRREDFTRIGNFSHEALAEPLRVELVEARVVNLRWILRFEASSIRTYPQANKWKRVVGGVLCMTNE